MSKPLPTSYRDVIDLWRSRNALARLLATPGPTVRTWHAKDDIPERRWMDLVKVAAASGHPEVTYALLNSFTPGAAA